MLEGSVARLAGMGVVTSAPRSFAQGGIRVAVSPIVRGLILFAAIVLLGNWAGARLRYPQVGSAVLFPPYAALAAALVLTPRRDWIWYIIVGSVAHFATHWPQWTLSWVLFADVANIARAVTAAVLLRWAFGCTPRLDSIRALVLFVGIAVLLAPALGALVGATNVVLHGVSSFGPAWQAWFMSNALTGLTLLPAFLAAVEILRRPARPIERDRVVEIALLVVALALTCALAFLLPTGNRWRIAALYAPVPVLIWTALRFGSGGASLALSATVIFAIWGTDRGTGPFMPSRDDDMLALQFFVLLTAVPVLCVAAVGTARLEAVQLFRTLLASLESQVAIVDGSGGVLAVNESWRLVAERTDTDPFNLVGPGDNYVRACVAAVNTGDPHALDVLNGLQRVLARIERRYETEYDHANSGQGGHVERFSITVEALERPDGGAVVIRTDVTGRRRAQLEIEEQRRELSHLARVSVLGQFSGALAHELKQPLAAIHSNAEAAILTLKSSTGDGQEIRAILDDILADDRRATQVINRLSALLQRGETRMAPIAPSELVNDVMELAHGELVTRRVTIASEVPSAPPPILGDRVQLQQVLLNLILNACDAMSNLPVDERRLFLTVDAKDRQFVHFAVRDSGPGIPRELLDRLFEPFVTTKPDGLGLGLSISRTIVGAHGGRLWAENNTDRGATLHCMLAAARPGAVTRVS